MDDAITKFFNTPQPLRITCAGCKKKLLEFQSWYQKKGAACPRCGTPFQAEAIIKAAERSKKRMDSLRKSSERLNQILSRQPKF